MIESSSFVTKTKGPCGHEGTREKTASGGWQPIVQGQDARQKRKRAKFAETRATLPILIRAGWQYRHERNTRIPGSKSIIYIIANVDRRGRIAWSKNSQQSVRIGLLA